MWSKVSSKEIEAAALDCCRGSYQRDVVLGRENLSGSTLVGRAAALYGGRYARSRRNLLKRLRQRGIAVGEVRGPHNRRILTLGGES